MVKVELDAKQIMLEYTQRGDEMHKKIDWLNISVTDAATVDDLFQFVVMISITFHLMIKDSKSLPE